MKSLNCPECGAQAVSFYKKLVKGKFKCQNCGEALALEGYSSIFLVVVAMIGYQILAAVFNLSFFHLFTIIFLPTMFVVVGFIPLVHQENRFSAHVWLYAIAATIIFLPFAGMGLYFVFN